MIDNLLTRQSGLALLCAVALAGCTLSPPPTGNINTTANAALERWQLAGKVGIRSEDGSDSAYLNWLQCQQRFSIRLSGPLGRTAARLQGDRQQVALDTADGRHWSGPNAREVLAQQLGWQLPVDELPFWLRGLPAPDRPLQPDPTGIGFSQSGWSLSFPRWQQVGDYQLPARVIAKHPRWQLTLVLRDWQLEPACGEQP